MLEVLGSLAGGLLGGIGSALGSRGFDPYGPLAAMRGDLQTTSDKMKSSLATAYDDAMARKALAFNTALGNARMAAGQQASQLMNAAGPGMEDVIGSTQMLTDYNMSKAVPGLANLQVQTQDQLANMGLQKTQETNKLEQDNMARQLNLQSLLSNINAQRGPAATGLGAFGNLLSGVSNTASMFGGFDKLFGGK